MENKMILKEISKIKDLREHRGEVRGMDEKLIKEVDQTIETLCECIKGGVKNNLNSREISKMTNALAALITARANARIEKIG
mgnify:CR=1 FL=1